MPAQGLSAVSSAAAVRSNVSLQLADRFKGPGFSVIFARLHVAVCSVSEAVAFPDLAVIAGACVAMVSSVKALPSLLVRTAVPVGGSRDPEVVVKRTSWPGSGTPMPLLTVARMITGDTWTPFETTMVAGLEV